MRPWILLFVLVACRDDQPATQPYDDPWTCSVEEPCGARGAYHQEAGWCYGPGERGPSGMMPPSLDSPRDHLPCVSSHECLGFCIRNMCFPARGRCGYPPDTPLP